MANIVYDLVDPAELIQYVRQFDNEVLRAENQDTLEDILPDTPTDELEFKVRKSARNLVDIAEYRAWDTPARMTGRPGVKYIRGSLGPVSRQIPLSEEEFLRVRALLRENNDPVIDQIYQDSENMIRAVQDRVELARGDIISDGKLTLAENGLVLEANWGRDAIMSVAAGTLWTTTATATPLSDLLAWTQAYRDLNGTDPATVLMSKVRIANLALNAEMRNYASANATTPTRLNRATIDAIFANEGLPPIRLYDRFVRKDGVITRILPQNKVFLLPPAGDNPGVTYYGPTAEAIKFAGRGLIDIQDAPGVVALVTETEHPVQTYTVGTAIAMPVMPNADLILDAVVA